MYHVGLYSGLPWVYYITSDSGIVYKALLRNMGFMMNFWGCLDVFICIRGKNLWTISQWSWLFLGIHRLRRAPWKKPDQSEWLPLYLCRNPRHSSPKKIDPDLSILIIVLDVIMVLEFSTQNVLTGKFYNVSGYEYIIMMISAQICTRLRCLPVYHWVTVEFLVPFFCVHNTW